MRKFRHEIIEFPVVFLNSETLEAVKLFQRGLVAVHHVLLEVTMDFLDAMLQITFG